MASHDVEKFVDGNGDEFNFRDPSKEAVANKVTSIRASSSASDDKYPSEKAVASAIEALDVSSVGGSGKYISAISETDGKISATATTMDTTPTANSTNAVTSGGIKTALDAKAPGAVTTEVTIANGDKMIIADASDSSKLKRASVAFDGSEAGYLLSKKGTFEQPKEAYLTWGGKNFPGSYGPLDAAMIPDLGPNRLMFGKAEGISVEYTRDGGETWTDYGLTDSQKVGLFSFGQSVRIGKSDADHNAVKIGTDNYLNYKLRITITTNLFGVYTTLNKWCFYVSTSGSRGSKVTVYAIKKSDVDNNTDNWVTVGTMGVSGWSGFNILNTSEFTTYGNDSSQYLKFRILAESTSANTNPNDEQYLGLSIIRIMAFGGVGWSVPSNMAKNGHLYSFDAEQNAIFPAKVKARYLEPTNPLAIAYGGTGGTTKEAAEYNILSYASTDLSDSPIDNSYRFVFGRTAPSSSVGRISGFRTALAVWTWIKGKLSSDSGVNISGSSASCTGNAATATDLATNSVLSVAKGGTGQTTETNVIRETIQTGLVDKASATSDVTDATEIITTHATSGYTSSTKDLYRRPATKLWNYIKDKISSVLGLSTTGYTGNAATASAAKSGSALETAINGKAPTNHASSSDTYGKGTTSNYGHVKLATGDMNGASNADGEACSKNHTHSQYLTSHQDISGKMATDGSNATSAAGGNIIRAMTNWNNINDDEVFPAASASSQGKYSFSRLWAWIKGKGLAGFDTNAFSPSDETTRAYRRLVLGKTTVLPSSDPVLVMASCIIKVHVNYKTDNANGMSITMLASIAYRTASDAEMRLDVIGSSRWKFDQFFPNLVSFPITEDGGTKNVICLAFTSGMTGTSLQTLHYSYVDIIPVGRVNGFTWMDTGDNQDSYSYIARCVRKLEPDGDNNRGLMLVNNSVESWLSAGYDSNNKVYIDSTSTKNGVYVKNGGSGKWMCYSDRNGNCKFEGDADTVDGYHIVVGSYSSSTNTISLY